MTLHEILEAALQLPEADLRQLVERLGFALEKRPAATPKYDAYGRLPPQFEYVRPPSYVLYDTGPRTQSDPVADSRTCQQSPKLEYTDPLGRLVTFQYDSTGYGINKRLHLGSACSPVNLTYDAAPMTQASSSAYLSTGQRDPKMAQFDFLGRPITCQNNSPTNCIEQLPPAHNTSEQVQFVYDRYRSNDSTGRSFASDEPIMVAKPH